jgi:uncharacterized membrane protein (UPF0127 family)
VRRDKAAIILVSGVLMILAVIIAVIVWPNFSFATVDLQIGDDRFRAKVVSNDEGRQKGLAGVTEMAENEALLMAYPQSETWGIWMKDMNIPIDIVWLDTDKRVVYIVKNASPDWSTSRIFTPSAPAKYVVELPAGTVDKANIKPGSAAVFNINESAVE